MLDFAHKTLDQMPLTIQPFIVFAQDFGSLMRRNNRLDASIQQVFDEMGCRIAAIGNQMLKIKALQQILRLGDVMTLTSSQAKTQWVAQSVYRDVDFSGKSASTASKRLLAVFFSAPAAQGWARTMVLSIMPYSISGSSAK